MAVSSNMVILSDFKVLYLVVVSTIALFLLVRGLVWLQFEKRRRLKQVKNMDFNQAVFPPQHVPEEDVEQVGEDDGVYLLNRRRAVQGIEARFHFMKRFYIPTVLVVTLTLLIIPFLPTIPATYLSVLTGLLAGVVGLAARPVIENAIAGLVLTFSQPIRINDTVIIDGQYGTVEKINLLHTVIKVWNWRRLVVPNHNLLQKEIENLTLGEEDEWAFFSFYVEPSADIELVKKLAKKSMQSPYRDNSEEPSFWVMEMEKDSILCWVAGWATDPARAWALKAAARVNLITELKKHSIVCQMANTGIHWPESAKSNATPPFNKP